MDRSIITKYTVCILAATVMFTACAGTRKSYLPARVSSYHDAYKWKNFHRAAMFVDDPEDFLRKMKKTDQRIEIAEYEIISLRVNEECIEAIVEIRRTYTVSPSVTAHSQIVEQKWKFDRKKKDWFLVSPY